MLPRTCAIAVLIAHATAARAGTDRDTGTAACGACHAEIRRGWSRTPHARASLRAGEARSPRCRACHMTDGGSAPLPGVGCEACHGAGVDYAPDDVMRDPALARALGLRDLSTPARREVVCLACHRESTRLARFDPEAAWQRIRHSTPGEARP